LDNQRLDGLELMPGQIFQNRYRVVMPIGKGGMGRVYLAEDLRLGGKTIALKLTRPHPDERRTFLPEAQLLSVLDHPHLPAIVDYYPPDAAGIACMVMDYIAGDTLAERFERYSLRLSFLFVLGVLVDLCEVLIYLHAHNPAIVFRDLKPSNVLLDRHNRAILVDFGIARRYEENRHSDTLQLGTPGFAAPEQLRGEQSDHRTDLYGLGALAYFLLSGGQFAIRRQRERLEHVLQDDIPTAFLQLLERLLANVPGDRPQSAYELSNELKAIQQELKAELTYTDRCHDSLSQYAESSRDMEMRERVSVVAVHSAYPGAGATFTALALSSSLSRLGVAHALVECPSNGSAELYALLDGARRMPRGAVYAQANGQQAAAPAWRNGTAHYYPVQPNDTGSLKPNEDFAKWLRRLGVPIVVLDVSSSWVKPELMKWLIRSVDYMMMVADCYPVKWSPNRQEACMELLKQARQRRIQCTWVANRDQPFSDRKQWLSLFPVKPDINMPELPNPVMLDALWRGAGIPSDEQSSNLIDQSFHKWIATFIHLK